MDSENELQPLRVLRAFTVAKTDDGPNEDRYFVSEDKSICALSDGASVSYDPGPWAAILCRRFIASPDISSDWLKEASRDYQAEYDREAMSWSQQGAFDRGSSATLMGVVCSADSRSVRVFAVGDSILAFVESGCVVRSIPYLKSEEFDQAPILFSTNSAENTYFDEEMISEAWHDLEIASHPNPMLLLMTDALGRWLLDEPMPPRVSQLLELSDDTAFAEFVLQERLEGRLKRDDSTLIVIG